MNMPAVAVLILCKTISTGHGDQNSHYTGWQNREWATEHAQMVCRRQQIELYDQAVDNGAQPQPFNEQRCWMSAIALGATWDASHPDSMWRFRGVACPVPIRQSKDASSPIIGYKIPDGCGKGTGTTVVCEGDVAI